MSEVRIVIDLALLLLISGGAALVFAKIRMPPILGYITAGIILGPSMIPDLWVEGGTVELLSSIGIVMLLFYIGLETEITELREAGPRLLIIVLVQMPLMVALGYLTGILLGMTAVQSIFLGAIISGTSTAVVVGVLKTAKHINAKMAKNIITITIFEDVGQVLILTMAAPLLAGDTPALGSTVNMIIGLVLFIMISVVFGMTLIPLVLDRIGRRYSTEILLIVAVGACFAMAGVSSALGLDIAIGAFLMGMIISLSKFGHKILQKVEPVKELFMAVFFVSIGLQVSPQLILGNLGLALIIAGVFIASKLASIWLGCYLTNMTARDSLLVATSLLAMGEFAFIIAAAALGAGVVSEGFYAAVIGAALITMFVMPLITKAQPVLYQKLTDHMPSSVRCALDNIDDIHAAASAGLDEQPQSPARAAIRRSIYLIFVDGVVMVTVLLLFNALEDYATTFATTASNFNLLPQELLLILLIITISPVIYNMHTHVKRIAQSLTTVVMESPRKVGLDRTTVYKVFANVFDVVLIIAILVLLIPLMPGLTLVGPLGVLVALVCGGAVIALAWDALHRVYARFCQLVTGPPREGR